MIAIFLMSLTLQGHKNEKHCHFALYYALKYIVMGSEDNNIYVWSLATSKLIEKISGHNGTSFLD